MAKQRPAGTVGAKELAEVLDCTTRQVEKYCEEGLVIRVERGCYHFTTSIRNVVAHLRKQAANNISTAGDSVADAAIRFRDTQTRLSELRIAKMEGTLISMEELEDVWGALVGTNRQLIQSIPSRIRMEIPTITAAQQKIITQLCHDLLTETALGEGRRPKIKQSALAGADLAEVL